MNVVRNVPGFWTSVFHWIGYMLFISILPKRLKAWQTWLASAAFLAIQTALYIAFVADRSGVYFNVTNTLFALTTLIPFVLFCEIGIADAVYYCARAFILAAFGVSIAWQFYALYVSPVALMSGFAGECAFMIVTAAVVFLAAYLAERGHAREDAEMSIKPATAITTVLLAVSVYVLSSLSYMSSDAPFTSNRDAEIFALRSLVYFGGTAMLFALHFQLCDDYSRRERNALQNVLNTQYANFRANQESINIVNQKYHDLKHQIALLRSSIGDDKKLEYLDEVEREIGAFEAQNKTGNEILDTILTGKSLYCHEHGITLTCVADGKLLDFLSVMDMSAIFGNALDNAIESVEKLPDPAQRLIHVTLSRQKGFASIIVRNRYGEEPHFSGALPVTSKGDRENHGYGLRSIVATAEKHGGTATVGVKDGWFSLNVLLPIK
ncbi:MAG: sensor histidine kinase [Oscillospiraceae bacterium]|nr:sensor histidine kinase [Oscillospiraceae bacterium]